MLKITDLSTELLLSIASHLTQTDLLNVSVTSKHLRSETEYELYREYYNPHLHRRSVKPFVLRLLDRPDLAVNVRSIVTEASTDMNGWQSFMGVPDENLFPGTSPLTRVEYEQVTQAAVGLGLIAESVQWEIVLHGLTAMQDTQSLEFKSQERGTPDGRDSTPGQGSRDQSHRAEDSDLHDSQQQPYDYYYSELPREDLFSGDSMFMS
jgi:hypothetical protein